MVSRAKIWPITWARSTSSSTTRMRAFSPGPQSTRASSARSASSSTGLVTRPWASAGSSSVFLLRPRSEARWGYGSPDPSAAAWAGSPIRSSRPARYPAGWLPRRPRPRPWFVPPKWLPIPGTRAATDAAAIIGRVAPLASASRTVPCASGSRVPPEGAGRHLLVGQEHPERRAANRVAFRPDAPRMLLHDGPADGQAQPAAALLARIGRIHLLEPAENGLQLVGRDAAALVDHRERDARRAGPHHHRNRRIRRRELDRVRQQVGHHLQQPVGIARRSPPGWCRGSAALRPRPPPAACRRWPGALPAKAGRGGT